MSLDESLFRWINRWPEGLAPFWQFLSEGNKAWPVRIGLAAVILTFFWKGGRWRAAASLGVLAWLASNEVCDALKDVFQAQRPSAVLQEHDLILRVKRLTSFGTASAHAASMAAVAMTFSMLLGRWGWPWIVLALLVGLSRVFVGVHYPSQMVLGWAVGAFVGWMAVQAYRALGRVSKGEPSETSTDDFKKDEG